MGLAKGGNRGGTRAFAPKRLRKHAQPHTLVKAGGRVGLLVALRPRNTHTLHTASVPWGNYVKNVGYAKSRREAKTCHSCHVPRGR